MHTRLAAMFGKATGYRCVDCGGGAEQWSYDHLDPDELASESGPYSTSPDHYKPRCIPCHKRFDHTCAA